MDLSEILHRVGLGSDGWAVSQPQHSRWLTADIWELTRGDLRLVVKRLARQRDGGTTPFTQHWSQRCESPDHWNYWCREALAYQSGVVQCFAEEGLRAPKCVRVDITDDDAVVAMEFVDGIPAERWDLDIYAAAARCLGAAQGRLSVSGALPDVDWLSQQFLRDYSTEKPVAWELIDDDQAWDQPLVAENFPATLRSAAKELHAQRDRLCSLLESLPRNLCHLDFWTKNLIQVDDGSFVLLDWAFVGIGALGEDIGNLVPDAAFDLFVEAHQLPDLRGMVLSAYVDGLGDSGWNGDPRVVELAMAASAVKYDWLTPLMLERASESSHRLYGGSETVDSADLYAKRGAALLDNAQQGLHALQLAEELAL